MHDQGAGRVPLACTRRRSSSAWPARCASAEAGATERDAARSFFRRRAEVTPDKQGRVAIPPHLARVTRALDKRSRGGRRLLHIEIWDARALQRA